MNNTTFSHDYLFLTILRRVWRYQRCNQNTYIEEEQTTQWPKEQEMCASQNTPVYINYQTV